VAIDLVSPNPPASGDNAFEVTVKQPDGSPVTDATVAAVFSMPAMPSMNMPAMRTDVPLTHAGGGTYRGAGNLAMSGTWNVAITVTRDGASIGTRKFSVIAK
jgi:nitrogen fixation protein FixH